MDEPDIVPEDVVESGAVPVSGMFVPFSTVMDVSAVLITEDAAVVEVEAVFAVVVCFAVVVPEPRLPVQAVNARQQTRTSAVRSAIFLI